MKKDYELKKQPEPRICRLEGCNDPIKARGICNRHTQQLRSRGRYNEFAAPVELTLYDIKDLPGKKCHIIENGKGCRDKVHSRGICSKHYNQLYRRGLYEVFALAAR